MHQPQTYPNLFNKIQYCLVYMAKYMAIYCAIYTKSIPLLSFRYFIAYLLANSQGFYGFSNMSLFTRDLLEVRIVLFLFECCDIGESFIGYRLCGNLVHFVNNGFVLVKCIMSEDIIVRSYVALWKPYTIFDCSVQLLCWSL